MKLYISNYILQTVKQWKLFLARLAMPLKNPSVKVVSKIIYGNSVCVLQSKLFVVTDFISQLLLCHRVLSLTIRILSCGWVLTSRSWRRTSRIRFPTSCLFHISRHGFCQTCQSLFCEPYFWSFICVAVIQIYDIKSSM